MSQPADWSHLCHLKTCVWMVIALIHAGNVNLTKWSMYIPCRGRFAQSRQRRIQRWLNNPRINVHRIYKSLVKATLTNWSESKIGVGIRFFFILGRILPNQALGSSSRSSFTARATARRRD